MEPLSLFIFTYLFTKFSLNADINEISIYYKIEKISASLNTEFEYRFKLDFL